MPTTILWADDEIELLKPQLLYLRDKGYEVLPVTNGQDALDAAASKPEIDLVFLDENMPGLSGLETLSGIKAKRPNLPVVMITKNEAEDLMEEAIGSQITDYLIKPVKPQQILMTVKKIMDNKRLVTEKTNSAYQQDFQRLFMRLQEDLGFDEWAELYRELVRWEIELDRTGAGQMQEVFSMQKQEANTAFNKFVVGHYLDWAQGKGETPVMSHTLLKRRLFPLLEDNIPTFLVVIDNLRYDQFRSIQPMLSRHFRMQSEELFYSILPTATQYSRNALFAGLMPSEIERKLPKFWRNDEDKGGKNMFEAELLADNLQRHRIDRKMAYHKVVNHQEARNLNETILHGLDIGLTAIVYNFVDMLSHARTEMEVLKELARDERAYRSLTESWFEHSPLFEALKRLEGKPVRVVVTTDHGTIRVRNASKVVGDRNTTTNLRYKSGKNLQYNAKDVLEVRKPEDARLPRQHVSSSYIFAKEDLFFVYPNNYNHYVNFFRDTFQHGGISLEEMLIPFAVFTSK